MKKIITSLFCLMFCAAIVVSMMVGCEPKVDPADTTIETVVTPVDESTVATEPVDSGTEAAESDTVATDAPTGEESTAEPVVETQPDATSTEEEVTTAAEAGE